MARFGAYEILHELKHGGMGAVLLGRKKGPGGFEQLVAIKVIRPEYANTEAVRAMFLDEAKILGGLGHPNIANVHDFGEDTGSLYMVMEYVAGISFRNLLEMDVPPGVAAKAIAEACRGVHAAHEVRDISGHLLNVVHRDISPDNLLLGFDGHVKVIDFGIALVKNRQAPVTEFGTVKGKPPYMSPEQVKNEALDRRSDVFSLGVVLHELLTGERLFDGDSVYAVALAVDQQEIRPPSQVLGAELPAGLDAAVMNALERDPERRTPTAAAFAEQLEQAIAAAGDETLQAWADRMLAGARDQHREWLAGIVAGVDTPTPVGRATGSVTALGPLAFVDQLPAAAPPKPELADTMHAPSDPATHVTAPDDEDGLSIPPTRSRAFVWLGLLLVAAAAVVIFLVSRSPSATALPDASVIADAAPVVPDDTTVPPPSDAAPPVAHDAAPVEVLDAAPPPRDAAAVPRDTRVVILHRDAGRRIPRDAHHRVVAIDAPAPPPRDAAPTTFGKLIVKHAPTSQSYLEVYVDGNAFGKTPILVGHRIPTGHHVVTLVRPDGGAVVYRQEVVIAEGKTTVVQQR